ncbi:bifunctional phosphopantothenoylcysteine decarboxylase/phosphopantothenate--cysteine ligase CoaBC [candidate division KSB1 bacterium]|nr:bifunctional phosphopantothenoylcysteine decarboxylase/phosphopantothenate--cysteine ligase CoaBC [candidate division KSB1 bacterium]
MKGNRPPYSPPAARPDRQDLAGRKILLGITGGIAAYKAVELARLFVKNGARVQVVMTREAEKFVAPLTFEAITARSVYIEMFPAHGTESPWHTEIATWCDLAMIVPATANCMAKLAAGLCDDLLTTLMLTIERPRVICPAMNPRMWANPATQDNLATLKRRGYRVIMPEEGPMARPGEEDGIGRLAEPESIYRDIKHVLSAPQDLRGVRVLVTAGRTEESWDPVRVLTNRASGRMGFALAEEARERGADVMLIHGPTDVIPPTGVRIRTITTAAEMTLAVRQEFPHSNILLMSAAVADYTFESTAQHKIKKGLPASELKLIATEDILKSLAGMKGNRVIVGFALETENVLENALRKLREKHLDIVVANNPLEQGSGFAGETNQVLIIHRSGRVSELPLQSKREVSREILNAVISLYRHPEPEPELEPEIDTDLTAFDDEPDLIDSEDVEFDTADDPSVTLAPPQQQREDLDRHETRSSRRRKKKRRGDGPRPTPGQGQTGPTAQQAPPSAPKPAPVEATSAPKAEPAAGVANGSKTMAPKPLADSAPPTEKKGKTRRGGRRQRERQARIAARQISVPGQSELPMDPAPGARLPQSPPPVAAPAPVAQPALASEPAEQAKPKRARKPKVETAEKPAAKAKKAPAKKVAAKRPAKKKSEVEA